MNKYLKFLIPVLLLICSPLSVITAQTPKQKNLWTDTVLTEPLAIVMLIVIILLFFVIAVLGRVVVLGVDMYRKKIKAATKGSIALVLFASFFYSSFDASAQEKTALVNSSGTIGGLSEFAFYLLFGIIILEVIVILILISLFFFLIRTDRTETEVAVSSELNKKKRFAWIDRLNKSKYAEGLTEDDIDMGHDFDGIKELDNPTPPWWQWGFIISVIAGVIYVWRYDIAQSAPNQYQELAIKTERAEAAVREYLANSANNVDENTVVFLADPVDLAAGQKAFVQMCAACHANDGGGNAVGPNLTDDYWLHGGSINDIFKTIKYGVPEKGMKSWKDDYSPKQMAQIASFVKSLKGTKAAEPREPQGELYIESEINESEQNTNDVEDIVVEG